MARFTFRELARLHFFIQATRFVTRSGTMKPNRVTLFRRQVPNPVSDRRATRELRALALLDLASSHAGDEPRASARAHLPADTAARCEPALHSAACFGAWAHLPTHAGPILAGSHVARREPARRAEPHLPATTATHRLFAVDDPVLRAGTDRTAHAFHAAAPNRAVRRRSRRALRLRAPSGRLATTLCAKRADGARGNEAQNDETPINRPIEPLHNSFKVLGARCERFTLSDASYTTALTRGPNTPSQSGSYGYPTPEM